MDGVLQDRNSSGAGRRITEIPLPGYDGRSPVGLREVVELVRHRRTGTRIVAEIADRAVGHVDRDGDVVRTAVRGGDGEFYIISSPVGIFML